VLSLRFAETLGFIHRHLSGTIVFFNDNGVIQVADVGRNGFEGREVMLGRRWLLEDFHENGGHQGPISKTM
jgi:hypothetical protein